jgi:hypothetical protein
MRQPAVLVVRKQLVPAAQKRSVKMSLDENGPPRRLKFCLDMPPGKAKNAISSSNSPSKTTHTWRHDTSFSSSIRINGPLSMGSTSPVSRIGWA